MNSKNWTKSQKFTVFLLVLLIVQVVVSSVKWGFFKPEILWGVFSRANGSLTLIAFALLALVTFNLSDETFMLKVARFSQWVLTFEVGYGLLQWAGKDPVDWVNPYSPIILTVGNPNFAASLLSVLSLLNLGNLRTSSTKTSIYGTYTIILSALAIFISYLTSSIQGLTAFFASVILFALFAALKSKLNQTYKVAIFSFFILLSIPVILGFLNIGPLAARIYQYTLAVRLQYWQVGVDIVRNNPFFGVGPDQYGDSYLLYRKSEFVKEYGFFLFTNNAHNVVIQWSATVGLLAGLILLTIFLLVFIRTSRMILKEKTFDTRKTLFLVAWVAYFLQSLISIEQIGIAVWGWLLTGTLLGLPDPSPAVVVQEKISKSKKNSLPTNDSNVIHVFLIPIIVFSLIPSSSFVRNDVRLKQSFQIPGGSADNPEAVNRGNYVLKVADDFLGMRDYTNLVVKNFLAVGPSSYAQRAAEIATSKNPDNSEAWNWLSETRARSGDLLGSILALKQSVLLDPWNDSNKMIIAKRYLELGDLQNSRIWAQDVINSSDPTIQVAAKEILDKAR
jgi:O-antigen ligase